MAEIEAYESTEVGSEYKQGYDLTDYKKLIEEEGVFVKEHYRETNKDTGSESIWNVYYIPSKDAFVTSMSDERAQHLFVTVERSEIMIEKYKEILRNNNENS